MTSSPPSPPQEGFPDPGIHNQTRYVLFAQVGIQAVSLLALLGLYRLVDPAEFGLLGMIMPVVLLLRSFGALGFNIAAVQQRDLSDAQATTLFWWQVASGAVLTLVLAAVTPVLAAVYETPQLLPVGLAISLTAILSNLFTQHQAMAERRLKLGLVAVVRLVALSCAGAIALACAWVELGVWALVIYQHVELLVLIGGMWWIEPWRPSRPTRGTDVRRLVKFGGLYTASGIFFAVAQNLDKLLLAYFLGGTPAGQQWIGYYTQAFNQMMRPVYLITNPVASAMLPSLASVKRDAAALTATATTFYRLVAVTLAPAGIGIFLVGDRLLPLLAGSAWEEAGTLLAILGLSIVTHGLINICGSLLAAVGRADLLAIGGFVYLLVMGQAIALVVLFTPAGPELARSLSLGLAWAYTLVTLLYALPYLYFCFVAAGLPPWQMLWALRAPLRGALLMGAFVLLAKQATLTAPTAISLAVQILVGVVSYLVFTPRDVRHVGLQLLRRPEQPTPRPPAPSPLTRRG